VPKPYPTEFRDDVVCVARDREPGVTIEHIAKNFGVHPMTRQKWLQRATVDDGTKPVQPHRFVRAATDAQADPAPRVGSRGSPTGGGVCIASEPTRKKGWYPLVKELTTDRVPASGDVPNAQTLPPAPLPVK
jgi:putative transposase